MTLPKISVVTISFNQARFLERALRSVLDQDYPNIEYIVVDPGSSDGSRDIIEQYRDQLAHVVFEKDAGPADGLNKGLALCTGDYFCYLNSDDFLLPGAIRSAIEILEEDPDLAFVTGDGFIVDTNDVTLKRFISAPFSLWRYAYRHSIVCQQSTFFRRKAVLEVGGFNRENRTTWDAELLIQIVRAGGKGKLVHQYWSAFRLHDESITTNLSAQNAHDAAHTHLFRLIMGRDQRRSDAPLRHLAKLARWACDPRGLYERLRPL